MSRSSSPQISWREGIPHSDEGGGRVHDKGGVHGHGPWHERRHQSWKSHRPTRTVGRCCRSSGVTPTVTSSSSAAADGLLITKVASLGPSLLGAALLTALYTEMATTTLASPRFVAFVTLRRTQSPCALCHRDRAPLAKEETSRSGKPRQALGVMPSRGEVSCRGFSLGEALQAWSAWSLAKIF